VFKTTETIQSITFCESIRESALSEKTSGDEQEPTMKGLKFAKSLLGEEDVG
jgi:hypothetical protein